MRFRTLTTIFFSVAASIAMAYEATVDGAIWVFSVVNGEAIINSYPHTSSDITIPSQLDGFPVTKISGAFHENYSIRKVKILRDY